MKNRKMLIVGLVILMLGAFLYRKRAALLGMATVFAFAGAFTLLLAPACRALERKGMHPAWAAGIAVGGFVLVVLLIVLSFIPYLITRTIGLIRRNAPVWMALLQQMGGALERFGLHGTNGQGIVDILASTAAGATALAARGSMAFAAQTGRILFAMVLSYYLLCERRRIANHLLLMVPPMRRAAVLSALMGCKNAAMGYLSGMLKTSAFVGVFTYLGLLLLGIQDALLLALFMSIFEILPYIGPVLAAAPILLSSLPLGWGRTLMALALVVLVQQIEGNFITPYVTASSTSIHPLAALISVFVLGSLLGIWGILLAVPLTAAAFSLMGSLRKVRTPAAAGMM